MFFADTPDYDEYFKVKEDVNFKIIDILQQGGVTMAYESTSVYMEKLLDKIKKSKENIKKK